MLYPEKKNGKKKVSHVFFVTILLHNTKIKWRNDTYDRFIKGLVPNLKGNASSTY